MAEVQSVEGECRNWKRPTKMLPKAPESGLLGIIRWHQGSKEMHATRKWYHQQKLMNPFCQLLNKYQAAFSTSSEGHRPHWNSLLWTLIQASVDLCHRDPIHYRWKHHNWVKKEIEQLEHVGVIEKSLISWTSPIVTVPKKSEPGEPPKRRMCIDYCHSNALQTEVDFSSRGCISLYPLLKIDKMFCQASQCQDLYHIKSLQWLLPQWPSLMKQKLKTAFFHTSWQVVLQHGALWLSPKPIIFSTAHEPSSSRSGLCNSISGWYNQF